MFFESHAHYNDEKYDEDREIILSELKENVSHLINIGTNIETSIESINLSKKYDFIYASVGIHPNYTKDFKDEDILKLENLCKENDKIVAIGEIGLDFYYDYAEKDIQKKAFIKQIELAKKLEKPIIVHSREANSEVYNIIKKSGIKSGVIHAFSGSSELALEYNKLGFYVGVGGVITFKNAKKLVEVVKNIDIKNILIETDAPYLTPEPFRGTRNNSNYLKYIVNKIAEIKNIPVTEVEKITLENGLKLFSIAN